MLQKYYRVSLFKHYYLIANPEDFFSFWITFLAKINMLKYKKINSSLNRTLDKSAYQKILFSYFSSKTYVVSNQKNRLNETVLLSTQNIW